VVTMKRRRESVGSNRVVMAILPPQALAISAARCTARRIRT
jgi:hypothetical protein